MSSLDELKEKVKQFNLDRDWDQFHNPKDLVIALFSEVGELAECYRWLNPEEVSQVHLDSDKKKKVEEEVADILMYMLMFAYKTDIDLVKVIEDKLIKCNFVAVHLLPAGPALYAKIIVFIIILLFFVANLTTIFIILM